MFGFLFGIRLCFCFRRDVGRGLRVKRGGGVFCFIYLKIQKIACVDLGVGVGFFFSSPGIVVRVVPMCVRTKN